MEGVGLLGPDYFPFAIEDEVEVPEMNRKPRSLLVMSGGWTDLLSATRRQAQLMWYDRSVLVRREIHSSGFLSMRPTLGSTPWVYSGADPSRVDPSYVLLISGPWGPEDHFSNIPFDV